MTRALFLALLFSLPAFGQGSISTGNPVAVNSSGQPLSGITVSICTTSACNVLATTYTDITLGTQCSGTAGTQPLNNASNPSVGSGCSNPGLTDQLGNVIAYAGAGTYFCQYSGTNITTSVQPCIFPASVSQILSGNNVFSGNNTFGGASTFSGPTSLTGGSISGTFSSSATLSGLTTLGQSNVQLLNKVLNAASYSGSGIDAQVNAAYASPDCPSTGCTIQIPPGTYSGLSTGIIIGTSGKPASLVCGGGAASFAGAPPQGSSILTFSASFSGTMLRMDSGVGAEVHGCQFNGTGTGAVGLQMGDNIGGSCVHCVVENSDFNVLNGTGLLFGQNVYIAGFYNARFHAPAALSYPGAASGSGESLNFYGGLFEGPPGTYSTTCANFLSSGSFNFYGTSFDRCGITMNSAGVQVAVHSGNIENPNFVTSADFVILGAACGQCYFDAFGTKIIEDGNGAGRAHMITNGANGGHVLIVGGNQIVGTEAPITAFVDTVAGSLTTIVDLTPNANPFTNLVSGAGAWVGLQGGEVIASGGNAFPAYVVGNQANILFNGATFSQLGTPTNGSLIFCSDCKNVVDDAVTAGAACVAGGHGAPATRENGAWRCN